MPPTIGPFACGSATHWDRRTFLRASGIATLSWLTPVAEVLARRAEQKSSDESRPLADSIILLWLAGGPSQLETFDPHPNSNIAAGTTAIETSVRSIQLAAGMEQTAEQMDSIALIRNVVSREGDHERAIYNVKTGYRPDPTLIHPSLGAIACHQLPSGETEIPRHVSILPDAWPSRGGFLGNTYDAFQLQDPIAPLPDMRRQVDDERYKLRMADLKAVEQNFARGRLRDLEASRTAHLAMVDRATRMMDSAQLQAFDVSQATRAEREPFGDTPFGRGCLAAARLTEVGVRCIEVTLAGWDSHVANHDIQSERKRALDPAFAALIQYLKERERLDRTIVICGGEFGRTPQVNPAGGRDHWPHGFSIALAGGGIRGGITIGETDPEGGQIPYEQGIAVADLHATVLHALGITHDLERQTPVGRPLKLSEGKVIRELLA